MNFFMLFILFIKFASLNDDIVIILQFLALLQVSSMICFW